MDKLPAEVNEKILLFVDYYDRLNLACVCKLWYILIRKHRNKLFYGINNNSTIYVMDDMFRIIKELNIIFTIKSIYLSSHRDKILVLSSSETMVQIISTLSGEHISFRILPDKCRKIYWSYDDSIFVTHTKKLDITFYDLTTNKVIKNFSSCCDSMQNSRRDKLAFVLGNKSFDSEEKKLVIYDFINENKTIIISLPIKLFQCQIIFSQDDLYIIISTSSQLLIYDLNGILIKMIELPGTPLWHYDYFHSKNILITNDCIWNLRDMKKKSFITMDDFFRINNNQVITYIENHFHLITLPYCIYMKMEQQIDQTKLWFWTVFEKYIYVEYTTGEIYLIDASTLKIVYRFQKSLCFDNVIF